MPVQGHGALFAVVGKEQEKEVENCGWTFFRLADWQGAIAAGSSLG